MRTETTHPGSTVAKLAAGVGLVGALLVAMVATATGAFAYHPESSASVECVEESIVLSWTVESWANLYGDDFQHDDVRVYAQYGTDTDALGGLTDLQIGSGEFYSGPPEYDLDGLRFSGTESLTPPEGATRVRVHSEAIGAWASGNESLPDPTQTTAWLDLPGDCTPPPPPPVIEASASVVFECEASAIVTITSTGGVTPVVVRVDGAVHSEIEVEGTEILDIPITGDTQITVETSGGQQGAVLLDELVEFEECVEGIDEEPEPTTTTTAPPTTTTSTTEDVDVLQSSTESGQVLPRTGAGTSVLAMVGGLMVATGVALRTSTRRLG